MQFSFLFVLSTKTQDGFGEVVAHADPNYQLDFYFILAVLSHYQKQYGILIARIGYLILVVLVGQLVQN